MEHSEYPLPRMTPRFTVHVSMMTGQDSGCVDGSSLQIVYVLQGTLTVRGEGKPVTLGEHDFMLLNPQEAYALEGSAGGLAARFQLSSVLALLGGREGFRFAGCSAGERKDADGRLRGILDDLLRHRARPERADGAAEARLTFELLYLLLAHYLAEAPKRETASGGHKPSRRLLDICAYLQANYRKPLTLNEVADDHYVSVPYLSKSFKKEIGMTFSDYLNRIRLDHAMTQLLHTDQAITRIALDSGFPSLTAFNRVFRERNGLTPSQYRQAALAPGGDARPGPAETLGTEAELLELEALLDSRPSGEAEVTVLPAEARQARPYRRVWQELINIGYARDLLNSDLQEQLSAIRGELGFGRARIWGIFGPEMMIDDPADPGAGYNFGHVDKVLDALLRSKLTPYLELGDKPKLIQKSLSEKMGGAVTRFKRRDANEWGRLMRAFLVHCINRYGKEEVESWTFELWHSSQHAFLMDGVERLVGQGYRPEGMEPWFDDYFVRFERTWREIKALLPGAQVGGCGLSMDLEGDLLPLLLERWRAREIAPDFLSVYLYPYEFRADDDGEPKFTHASDEQWILHALRHIRHTLAEHSLEGLPLHVTEWNFGVSNRDYVHDSMFKASYILRNMTDVLDEHTLMGYWLYSDIFSEFRDSKQPLHGGSGLISKNGIKKPAFHAFAFLNRMGEQLLGRGESFLLTRRGGGSYQLLGFHYRHRNPNRPGDEGALESAYAFERQAAGTDARLRRFRLEGLKSGSYRLKRSLIGADRGGVLREWRRFGGVDDIRPDELSFLQQVCVPGLSIEHVEVKDGKLEIESRLRPYEVELIELELRMDAL